MNVYIYIYIHTKVAEWSNERVRYMYIRMYMPHTVQQYHSRITLGPLSSVAVFSYLNVNHRILILL